MIRGDEATNTSSVLLLFLLFSFTTSEHQLRIAFPYPAPSPSPLHFPPLFHLQRFYSPCLLPPLILRLSLAPEFLHLHKEEERVRAHCYIRVVPMPECWHDQSESLIAIDVRECFLSMLPVSQATRYGKSLCYAVLPPTRYGKSLCYAVLPPSTLQS